MELILLLIAIYSGRKFKTQIYVFLCVFLGAIAPVSRQRLPSHSTLCIFCMTAMFLHIYKKNLFHCYRKAKKTPVSNQVLLMMRNQVHHQNQKYFETTTQRLLRQTLRRYLKRIAMIQVKKSIILEVVENCDMFEYLILH